MSYSRLVIAAAGVFLFAQSASAQVIGTFRWNTAPYCNVMNLTVEQVGGIYRLDGYEDQCGGNPRLPIWGIGVPQANGSIVFGLSVVPSPGTVKPIAIRATVNPASNFGGSWQIGTETGTLVFNPASVSGGPRTTPVVYDADDAPAAAATGADLAALRAEIDALKSALAALLAKQEDE
jgi:hypothetical protein